MSRPNLNWLDSFIDSGYVSEILNDCLEEMHTGEICKITLHLCDELLHHLKSFNTSEQMAVDYKIELVSFQKVFFLICCCCLFVCLFAQWFVQWFVCLDRPKTAGSQHLLIDASMLKVTKRKEQDIIRLTWIMLMLVINFSQTFSKK